MVCWSWWQLYSRMSPSPSSSRNRPHVTRNKISFLTRLLLKYIKIDNQHRQVDLFLWPCALIRMSLFINGIYVINFRYLHTKFYNNVFQSIEIKGLGSVYSPVHHPTVFSHKNPNILPPDGKDNQLQVGNNTIWVPAVVGDWTDLKGTSSMELGTLADRECSGAGLEAAW